jgi:hypothetical protein
MFMSKTKGFRGTLEAALSEAIIIATLLEACYSLKIIFTEKNRHEKTKNMVRSFLLFLICLYESTIFFIKADKHYERYSIDLDKNEPHSVNCLSQSIGSISVLVYIIKFFLTKTRSRSS